MAKVSNKFFITTIQDGQTITVSLISNMKLAQNVSTSGSCIPNWNAGETGAVNPEIYVYSRINGTVKAPTGTGTWLWNGVPITFDANHKSDVVDASGLPVFEETTVSVGGVSLPAIRIIRNLGSAQNNTDNDIISYSGSLEIGGVGNAFAVDTVVRISIIPGGTGYTAISGGDTEVTSNDSTDQKYKAKFYAQLYNGTDVVNSGIKAQFFREGIDTTTPFATDTTASATEETTPFGNKIPANSYVGEINASQITDRVVIRCDFLKNDASNEKLASVWFDIDDKTDPEEMFIVNSTGSTVGQSDIQLRSGQSVTIKAWMGFSNNMYKRDTSYTTFKCMLTNAQGQVIMSGNPIPSGKTVDSNGYFDITKSNVTVLDKNSNTLLESGVGGEITISASDIDTYCGGGLGGIITAETTSQV